MRKVVVGLAVAAGVLVGWVSFFVASMMAGKGLTEKLQHAELGIVDAEGQED